MAAEVLARGGAAVTVFEQMPSPGRKLQLAGRGGLNITHSEPLEVLLTRYGAAREHLAPSIRAFGSDDLRAWCAALGQETFVGSSGRVFPAGFRATALLRSWLRELEHLGVDIRVRHTWQGWDDDGALLVSSAAGPSRVKADATVLAVGGASWPRVGSDGRWVPTLAATGVELTPLRPANCGFTVGWSEPFRQRFAGVPLKNVGLVGAGSAVRGEAMITETGIEGGGIYALSPGLRETIAADGHAVLAIDLRPDLTTAQLVARLERRRPKDSASTMLRRAGFTAVAIGLLREASGNRVPTDRDPLAQLAKALPLRLLSTEPIERAISTAGGVAFGEVDESFMLRRRPGTFVAGEMLDWEAPTGGYLLQGTFSTAVAAANGALDWMRREASAAGSA
jgi:uncharacterized flavoprotein (TIGR03862 family)